ncbi:MAG: YitT family protein, partial [Clostridia bacterium]|nr:YitT family protein [Clostridia bacterium]
MEEKELKTEHTLPPKITKENIDPDAGSAKGQIMLWVRGVLYSMLSALLIAIAAYSLIAPNNFTIGGASGVAILVNVATKGRIPQWLILFSINAPLVILAFFFVKKRFAILSAMNIGMQSLFLLLLEEIKIFDHFKISFDNEAEKIFAAIAAGLCIGTAIALAFKVGGSTGGADIVAVMIQRKVGATSIAWMIFALNVIVIGTSLFVFYDNSTPIAYNLLPIMLSAFESYIESKTNESMMNGFQSAREFRIITDKPEEMAQALMKELSRGVTAIPATGMYTKITHTMLLCVVSRRQVITLKRIMK